MSERKRSPKEEQLTESEERLLEITQEAEENDLFETDDTFYMLHGYKDEEGNLHKDFELRFVTGRDQEAVQKADIKNNPSKMITTLLARCCTRIGTLYADKIGPGSWTEIIRKLYTGDQDYMLLKLTEISFGKTIKSSHNCPECGVKLNSEIDTDELEIIQFTASEFPFSLKRGYKDRKGVIHKEGLIRTPTGFDREILTPLLKKAGPARVDTIMLTRTMKFSDGYPVDDDVTLSLSAADRQYLLELLKDNYFGVKTEVDITCDSCGETFRASLNVVNFI